MHRIEASIEILGVHLCCRFHWRVVRPVQKRKSRINEKYIRSTCWVINADNYRNVCSFFTRAFACFFCSFSKSSFFDSTSHEACREISISAWSFRFSSLSFRCSPCKCTISASIRAITVAVEWWAIVILRFFFCSKTSSTRQGQRRTRLRGRRILAKQ